MFKRIFSLAVVVMISFTITANASVPARDEQSTQSSSVMSIASAAEDISGVMEIILANYVGEDTDTEKLRDAALKGMLSSLDPYSEFFSTEEYEQFVNDLNGNFVGIGIQIDAREDGYVGVVAVFNDSPAEEYGLKINDIICMVDDVDIKDMSSDEVVSRIRGEEGTFVKITVNRNDKQMSFDIKRAPIEIESVSHENIIDVVPNISTSAAINDKIGYIKISTFANNTFGEFKNAYDALVENNVSYLILDLRDNPGGYLHSVVDIARLLVPTGNIVTLLEKSGPTFTYKSSLKESPFEKIAVLVNGNSASASEILASAIKDSKAGVLIGGKTFGKGVVQSTFSFDGLGIIKLTTSEYITRNGTHIDKVGIRPNFVVKQTGESDNVISRAYNYFVGIDAS